MENEVIFYKHKFTLYALDNKAKCKYCDVNTTYDDYLIFTRNGMQRYVKSCISDDEKIIKDIIE